MKYKNLDSFEIISLDLLSRELEKLYWSYRLTMTRRLIEKMRLGSAEWSACSFRTFQIHSVCILQIFLSIKSDLFCYCSLFLLLWRDSYTAFGLFAHLTNWLYFPTKSMRISCTAGYQYYQQEQYKVCQTAFKILPKLT